MPADRLAADRLCFRANVRNAVVHARPCRTRLPLRFSDHPPPAQISRPNVTRLVAWKEAASNAKVWLRIQGRAVIASRNYAPFGVRDLYRGLSGAFVGTVPVALVYFAVYERAPLLLSLPFQCLSLLSFKPFSRAVQAHALHRRALSARAKAPQFPGLLHDVAPAPKQWLVHTGVKPMMAQQPVPDAVAHIASAAAGAVASAVVRVPTDTIRHRTQAFLHPNTFAAVPQLMKAKGLGGFYAGFRPTLMRDVPEIAIQFATYECLRAILQRRAGNKLATWQHLILGGASGAVAASITMPVDVLKTQLQCGGKEAARTGILRTVQQIVADKGAGGLFAGMVCCWSSLYRTYATAAAALLTAPTHRRLPPYLLHLHKGDCRRYTSASLGALLTRRCEPPAARALSSSQRSMRACRVRGWRRRQPCLRFSSHSSSSGRHSSSPPRSARAATASCHRSCTARSATTSGSANSPSDSIPATLRLPRGYCSRTSPSLLGESLLRRQRTGAGREFSVNGVRRLGPPICGPRRRNPPDTLATLTSLGLAPRPPQALDPPGSSRALWLEGDTRVHIACLSAELGNTTRRCTEAERTGSCSAI